MSKKMLKRSLALGALMAFVITGSAWAAEKTVGISNNTTHNNNDVANIIIQNSNWLDVGDKTYDVDNAGIFVSGNNDYETGEPTENNGETVNANDTIKIQTGSLDITSGDVGIMIDYGGKLYIDATTKLSVDAVGNAINTGNGDELNKKSYLDINAKNATVTIIAKENAIWARAKESTIIVDANILNVKSTADGEKPERGFAVLADGQDSYINLTASGLVDLNGVTGGILAKNASVVEMTASDNVKITSGENKSTVYADGKDSKVNLVGNGDNIITLSGSGTNWNNGPCGFAAREGGVATLEKFAQVVFDGNYGLAGLYSFDSGINDEGKVVVKDIGTITQTEGSYVDEAFYAFGGAIEVNANKIDLHNVYNGFFAQSNGDLDGEIKVTANTIDLKGVSGLISAVKMNGIDKEGTASITVVADNITLNASNGTGISTNNVYNNVVYNADTTITVTATNSLKVTGNNTIVAKHGVDATKTANVVLNTNIIDIEAADKAIDVADFGEVVIKANQTANIKGLMTVDGTSKLDLSGIGDLVLVGLTAGNENAAIQVAEGGTLKVNTNGTLAIDKAVAGTYKVVDGVGRNTMWTDDNLAYDRTELFATGEVKEDIYSVTYKAAEDLTEEEQQIAQKEYVAATGGEDLAVPGLVGSAAGAGSAMEETAPGAKEFLGNIASDEVMTKEVKAAVINSAAQLAEAGGNAGTAVSVANNVAGVTTGRMSFGGRGHGGHKGGHGVGMVEEGSGAAVWAQYMHGKDDATDMPMDGGATSYESEYDGIVLGVDFKKVGKFQSGIAFNYGEGDSNGFTSAAKTKSDYDFWGIGYYGNIRNDDTNFIFDINYAKSDSDVTQHNVGATGDIEASPETTTWSAGVKVEKLYQNESVQIVPYTGLRYMSIDTDEYKSTMAGETLFNYAPERQDIWLLPLGVTIKQEVVNDNGWVVTPKVDLSYIWAFGDTDSNMSVSIPGIAASNDTLGFTVMDDGSFLGLVGVEAKLDDWTFGVSYSYQKGDYAESKKLFVDAKYSF